MVKTWKIKRELRRLGTQLREARRLAKGPGNRARYDRDERPKVVITEGDRPVLGDVAILLIYQPDGVLQSLFLTLEHLAEKGISTILVANHPLESAEIDRLKPYCHLVVQRPNFGYDFGGYREGMLTLFDRGITPDTLFVLNDSVWFPLTRACTLIDRAKAAPEEVYGIFQNTKNRQAKHHHLQSYFYRFSGAVVADPRFRKFWRSMPFYDTKRMIIRQLEVKLTGKLAAMGYAIASRVTPQDVAAAGKQLSDSELLEVAAYHHQTTLRGRTIFAPVLACAPEDPAWPQVRDKAISHSRFKYYFIDAHPILLYRYLGAPFLKKSREYHYYFQRDAVIAGEYHTAFDPVVQSELLGWNAAGRPGAPEDASFQPISVRAKI